MSTEYTVEVQNDHLERLTKAQPVAAVAELIWNGLDADATQIDVNLSLEAVWEKFFSILQGWS